MNKKFQSGVAMIVGASLSIMSLSACATTNRNVSPQNTGVTPQQGINVRYNATDRTTRTTPGAIPGTTANKNPGAVTMPGVNPGNTINRMGQVIPKGQTTADIQRARNIEANLARMNGVSRANVLITGNTAIVGYTPASAAQDTNAVKTMIATQVKKIDPRITHVITTESGDVMTQIRTITNDIVTNRPASQVGSDVSKLGNKVIPTVK